MSTKPILTLYLPTGRLEAVDIDADYKASIDNPGRRTQKEWENLVRWKKVRDDITKLLEDNEAFECLPGKEDIFESELTKVSNLMTATLMHIVDSVHKQ